MITDGGTEEQSCQCDLGYEGLALGTLSAKGSAITGSFLALGRNVQGFPGVKECRDFLECRDFVE